MFPIGPTERNNNVHHRFYFTTLYVCVCACDVVSTFSTTIGCWRRDAAPSSHLQNHGEMLKEQNLSLQMTHPYRLAQIPS